MNINPKISSQHVYDYAIIGSGLSGLLMSAALSRATENIILIEANDHFGGWNQQQNTLVGPTNNGLRFLPDTELSRKSLEFLSQLLGKNLEINTRENALLTFDSGSLRPFLGFGSSAPAFYDELAYFLAQQSLVISPEVYEWPQMLFENSRGDFISRSHVTKFTADVVGNEDEEIKISRALVNGQKNILAHNFIYSGPLQALQRLLPEAGLSPRNRQKLSKAKFWTAVGLDLVHSTQTETEQLHVLNGASQDEIGPCVGRFYSGKESLQLSQWMSFIDSEAAEDSEQIAGCLKKIKRQIKRAYPTALDNLKSEKILIAPAVGGSGDLKLNANQSLQQVPNFWIANGGLSPQKNLLGCLQQASLVCSSLGFSPTENKTEMTEAEL